MPNNDCQQAPVDLVAYNASLSDEPLRKRILHQELDPTRHEYISIAGGEGFLDAARDFAFGFGDKTDQQDVARVTSVQAISGTGANHLGALLIARRFKPNNVWLPDPTWGNHYTIWDFAGVRCRPYPYYSNTTQSPDLKGMLDTLSSQASRGDAIALHSCAHNPTGTDPSHEQWERIAQVCQQLGLVVLFDSAYQGFATGDVDANAWAVRHSFHKKPSLNICVAQSFSKNFGLYGQRVGACHVALAHGNSSESPSVFKQPTHFIRAEYSMAPRWGSGVVKRILQSSELRQEWYHDLISMSSRIRLMREALYRKLVELQTPGSWDRLLSQNGMFSYTGLSPEQVLAMREKHHVYILQSGQISLSGLLCGTEAY
ncbi:probable aspartate aminotransferase, cytoplasmic [Fusarium fujikuroi]|nr:putative aspartate aminotransferase, cytoplasmic [Fusarium fujikuroi]KLP20407.1 putative aspartate aminotransferase, cytoplasmic [Fusarium fujikuroi]SCN65919.1 probable aspartate aminotransferase, cytoplasmic [Fusarium fujikuroi]SCN68825.1 probable aspartate aminotransferase, cytoplasmic [Fusarium fujikuroi]SCO05769.1 probable aspartate aminotransferase, cytoplasmic [Fusarium fujikuroi]